MSASLTFDGFSHDHIHVIMPNSDSDDDGLDYEFDGEDDGDGEGEGQAEEEIPDALVADDRDVTEDGDYESQSEDSEDASDEDEEDEDEDDQGPPSSAVPMDVEAPEISVGESTTSSGTSESRSLQPEIEPPSLRKRSLSPAQLRKNTLVGSSSFPPRSYTIEAICALPHPVPTHALASSLCMTHLLTGSDDGYIRDYDIFTAVNGKNFLTAPQRHHASVVEGLMKSGQLRFWWENPAMSDASRRLGGANTFEEELILSPVYSLAMHSDALWTLAGTNAGHINLFTIRHDPGNLCHVMNGHRGPVSSLAMDYQEKGFFSAGWDGEAIQWDLNNGQVVRNFTAHGAQLAAIAVRPVASGYTSVNPPVITAASDSTAGALQLPPSSPADTKSDVDMGESSLADAQRPPVDSDAKSDISFDPLFDDVPETETPKPEFKLAMPTGVEQQPPPSRLVPSTIPPPKNAPPLLDPPAYATYSPDLLLTASIDGQVIVWDRRVHSPGTGVGRLWMSDKTPPWCLSACWSADGAQIYAGRRNGTVDVWDVRLLGRSGPSNTPRLLKTLRNPSSSGVVSCVVAFPDCRHLACASIDNLRLWNVAESGEPDSSGRPKSGVPFKIIPGHHGGYISQMLVDPAAKFLVSASSNRGWHGDSTRTVFVHDIKHIH